MSGQPEDGEDTESNGCAESAHAFAFVIASDTCECEVYEVYVLYVRYHSLMAPSTMKRYCQGCRAPLTCSRP